MDGKLENPHQARQERRSSWLGTLFLEAIGLALKWERSSAAEEQRAALEHGDAVPVAYPIRRGASPWVSSQGTASMASVGHMSCLRPCCPGALVPLGRGC